MEPLEAAPRPARARWSPAQGVPVPPRDDEEWGISGMGQGKSKRDLDLGQIQKDVPKGSVLVGIPAVPPSPLQPWAHPFTLRDGGKQPGTASWDPWVEKCSVRARNSSALSQAGLPFPRLCSFPSALAEPGLECAVTGPGFAGKYIFRNRRALSPSIIIT